MKRLNMVRWGSVLLAFKTQEKNEMVVVKAGGSIDS